MSTGIAALDAHHRKLVDQVNELSDALRRGEAAARIRALLEWLGDYATMHFGYEEACMHQYRCPVAAENKVAHREFARVLEQLRARFERDGADDGFLRDVEQHLAGWVRNHICTVDARLGGCARALAG